MENGLHIKLNYKLLSEIDLTDDLNHVNRHCDRAHRQSMTMLWRMCKVL